MCRKPIFLKISFTKQFIWIRCICIDKSTGEREKCSTLWLTTHCYCIFVIWWKCFKFQTWSWCMRLPENTIEIVVFTISPSVFLARCIWWQRFEIELNSSLCLKNQNSLIVEFWFLMKTGRRSHDTNKIWIKNQILVFTDQICIWLTSLHLVCFEYSCSYGCSNCYVW